MKSTINTTDISTGAGDTRWFSKTRQRILLGAAAAAIIAVGVVAVMPGSDDSGTAWAAELVEMAESSPLILLDDPEWEVSRISENDKYGQGEMGWSNQGDPTKS